MTDTAKTVDQELRDIATGLFEAARLELARGAATPERALALGMPAGAVMRVRVEHQRPTHPEHGGKDVR